VTLAGKFMMMISGSDRAENTKTVEITILLIGSFIMVSLGILGEYIAKIYDETKTRPPYIVSSRCGFLEEGEPTRLLKT
jgi:hypothetical protein